MSFCTSPCVIFISLARQHLGVEVDWETPHLLPFGLIFYKMCQIFEEVVLVAVEVAVVVIAVVAEAGAVVPVAVVAVQ